MTTNTILLSDIASVERFVADLEAGRIQVRVHPDDPDLRIYSYSKMTQYGGLWTPESKLARGLILRVPNGDFDLAAVESRGLPKFFTVAQSQDDWGRVKLIDDDENVVVDEAPDIPWDLPAVVADKLNGALGLGYIDPSGLFRISTKGSFGSLEANVANRVLDSKYAEHLKALSQPTGSTLLFEIITPERPHPVDYGTMEDLIFLGTISNSTGAWIPARGDEEAVKSFGFPHAETHEVENLREAVALPYEDNTEGFVVTVVGAGPEAIYKVKPNEYLQLRKLFYALQETEIKLFVAEPSFAKNLSEVTGPESIDLSGLVGELQLNPQMEALVRRKRESLYGAVVKPAQERIGEALAVIERWAATLGPVTEGWIETIPQPTVARWVKTQPQGLQSFYFSIFSALRTGDYSRTNRYAINLALEGE